MSMIDQLSSQVGDRSSEANRLVADQCLQNPTLLDEIRVGLGEKDVKLLGDCAEVMTMVAEKRPEIVAAYAETLARLLAHKNTRVRWESAHALAYVAHLAPQVMAPLLPRCEQILHEDKSVIVRDYLTDAVGGYARTGPDAAQAAFPVLQAALVVFDGKQAGHALEGLLNVAQSAPDLQAAILELARPYCDHPRGMIKKAARKLVKTLGG